MFIYEVLAISLLTLLYAVLIIRFCRRFVHEYNLPIFLLFPMIIYSGGFILRISENKSLINIGFFLTDSVSTLLSILFAGALILGQLKFWRK